MAVSTRRKEDQYKQATGSKSKEHLGIFIILLRKCKLQEMKKFAEADS